MGAEGAAKLLSGLLLIGLWRLLLSGRVHSYSDTIHLLSFFFFKKIIIGEDMLHYSIVCVCVQGGGG